MLEQVRGTEGYAEQAEALVRQYESIAFATVHQHVLHLIPTRPGLVLDIGSGTGRDAAALAALGHRVVAVEPTADLRRRAAVLHPAPCIEWLDDGLPDLPQLAGRGDRFDLVMLTAVWMHLDEAERRRAMRVVAGLLRPGGSMILSLRHGPVPPGRRMFQVGAAETVELAAAAGLRLALRLESHPGLLGQRDVTWTRLAFAQAGG